MNNLGLNGDSILHAKLETIHFNQTYVENLHMESYHVLDLKDWTNFKQV